ncbi:MAG TPA: anaerobic ribonucleoside-triphosphate reductase activating protein [Deltaproteobacteria bacterium]|nr:MAG: hypothetical protein A2Z79_08270 [Deltaproteobacteria bacterium GWA2_55_82]OGQ63118.1 MAG: hypothetical protein A3I81_09900 [Deltaproteobacteria bacterium RIFCSPLOWO2_02_FULL_55_12]OIJ73582.1 MAG: hypothetical protein A2V21_304465 [Deltaproteobacteria bacterium GWC2_55_46]HBG47715.1 anaerobic ribonucleoside-triphosphate reductase activating protein [Deltaproteobacteria bacterium]HCY12063.1 anaerobic ribonucleoside-triphosphate reductase activating protein [Deltaproteobacteria bacterium]
MDGGLINIHAVLPRSSVNGPGKRVVVFFQGCQRRCEGCFNPATHPFDAGVLTPAEDILERYVAIDIEGLTVSGGEPFSQPRGLKALLESARARGLTTLVYTGFKIEEIEADPAMRACLASIDVLVDGPYDETRQEATLLPRGSTNQSFHFLTPRYSLHDLYMPGRSEVFIGADGMVRETGFSRITARPEIR